MCKESMWMLSEGERKEEDGGFMYPIKLAFQLCAVPPVVPYKSATSFNTGTSFLSI
jgi:hypothetical protein